MKKIEKATFEELYNTLLTMEKHVDSLLEKSKSKMKGKKIWEDFGNYKEYLMHIETEAVKLASVELGLSDSAVRDRWHILTMPHPVYYAIETDSISMSKAKYLTAISWDFDDPKDVEICEKIVNEIKNDISSDEIKEMVKKEVNNVWHPKHIVLQRLAAQNGITEKNVC
jgi:hypothetical protein